MYNTLDTIAAVATAPGESALAIVRLSGPKAKEIVESIFSGAKLENKKAAYGRLYGAIGEQIDEVVVIFYQKPHGFTAEDMAEIICHGGYVIPNQILNLLCIKGARLAEPGEFTFRAFMNGRIDLTEAEAVDTIIRAKSLRAKELALGNLEGKLQRRLVDAQERLLNLITLMESEIDFSDDEVTKTPSSSIAKQLREVRDIMLEMIATYDVGRLAEGRVQVAIVGAPNVGKSTLFNAIIRDNRAIVADTPGTTRDYLSEYVNIGGYPVILTDTAGIRFTQNHIESIGIDKTHNIIEKSSLSLFILDGSREFNEDDKKLFENIRNRQYILVVNKIDTTLNERFLNIQDIRNDPVQISAKNGSGLDILLEEIGKRLLTNQSALDKGVLLSQRQFDCAIKTQTLLDDTLDSIDRSEPEEIIASQLREAQDSLGEMVGKITSDDILNLIFSRFCIGK